MIEEIVYRVKKAFFYVKPKSNIIFPYTTGIFLNLIIKYLKKLI